MSYFMHRRSGLSTRQCWENKWTILKETKETEPDALLGAIIHAYFVKPDEHFSKKCLFLETELYNVKN